MKNFFVKVAVASLAAITLTASPAFAAQTRSLPANNTYYAIDCQTNGGTLVTVDVATSVATVVGSNTPTPNTDCAYQAAWNSIDESLYWISFSGGGSATLMKADLSTGSSTEVAPFSAPGSSAMAMAIDDLGNAYVITDSTSNPNADAVFSLNLMSGAMTWIADVQNTGGQYACVYAFAFNPGDGNFYLNCISSPMDTSIRMVNVTTGATTSVCDNPSGSGLSGFAFDENGIGWTADGGYSDLASFDVGQADCGWQSGGRITLNGSNWYTESNAIVFTPSTDPGSGPDSGDSGGQLPATGVSTGGVIAAAGLSIALIAGGLALARRRRA